MMLQMWRIMQAGARNFMRNAWLSTAATAVMTLTLAVVVISFISNVALSSTVKTVVTDKINISIYFKDTVTQEQLDQLRQKLEANENVESVKYISKEQAVADFKAVKKNDPQSLAALELAGNSLPSSFQIKAKDTKKLDVITPIIKAPEVQALLDPEAAPSYSGDKKSTIDNIVNVSNFFKTTGLVISVVFLIISTLIIFNTIRMAIFTRRDEIEIMKLVGATKWFIRGPFLFEAALYGIIAAIIATAFSYALLLGGGPKISNFVNVAGTIDFFRHYPLYIIGAELVTGIAIGMISSLLAMSRYLKL